MDREEKLAYQRQWTKDNYDKDRHTKYYRDFREKLKLEVLAAYGFACAECGIADPIVLTIHHMNHDGKQDRETNNHDGSHKTYSYLKRNGYPEGYQVLCHNCNFRQEYHRVRAHVETSEH